MECLSSLKSVIISEIMDHVLFSDKFTSKCMINIS